MVDGSGLLPVGLRVAYWRGRRNLSQQVFADRLGKSKSWVDKVERGVRTLDKVSTLQDIAVVLRIDTSVLLGRDVPPAGMAGQVEGVGRVREALSTYDIVVGRPVAPGRVLSADRLARDVSLAWATFQHARYPQLTGMLPGLLAGAQRAHAAEPAAGRVVLVQAYRITASLLVKLGELELAWLAADRAMTTAAGDVLAVAAAMAARVGDGHDHHRTAFGPVAVDLARVAAALDLGDAGDAVARHEKTTTCDAWRWLPAEHRAAHLLDAARAYLHVGDPVSAGRALLAAERTAPDPVSAGRALLAAERTAPGEVRHRPAAHAVLTPLAHDPHAPTTIVQLAAALRVT
ncbi:helix-turn-helix domain-containing protein [Micromonospora matsumotoense]|uniref:helix-turn-helix domain-containing protein n=1 Tax=Micromonospora matsumotoense TaxID=121616 RepID=UPI00340598BC